MSGFLHDLSEEQSAALASLKAGLPEVLATLERVPLLWGVPLPDGLPDTKPDALDIVLLKVSIFGVLEPSSRVHGRCALVTI
jgi:hypothetical protein